MKHRRICAVLLTAAMLLSGCADQSAAVTTSTPAGKSDSASPAISDSAVSTGDTIIALPAEEETAITTADTSGMDFSFTETDTTAQEASAGAAVEIPEEKDIYYITSGGSYTLSGTIRDTMVTVDAGNADVTLILSGADIQNSAGPAIYVRSAGKVTLTLEAGTTNTVADGTSYSITDSGSTLDGAVFSKADLTINGSGTLTVKGNYKHGIVSKDDLIISSGTLKVTSNNVGLNGKDCVKINSGAITINAGSDGIRSDNDEDASRGYVYLYGGSLNITAGNDGIQAETVVNIENVDLTITSGGGSGASLTSSDESWKGIKAGSDIYITGGIFNINSLDDCIHSNGTITISGGTISVVASDDGLNAAGGNDASSTGGRFGQGSFSASTGKIVISGGTLLIKANGDGLDANGTLSITGGNITVIGPTTGDTAILDFDSTGTISGGTFIGLGASSMAQNFSASSTQGVIMVMTGNQSAGTAVQLTDSSGNVILSYTAQQSFACVILSHPSIVQGGTYTLSIGGSETSITMTSTVMGSSGGMMGGNPGGMTSMTPGNTGGMNGQMGSKGGRK